jgi:hypothetical protein
VGATNGKAFVVPIVSGTRGINSPLCAPATVTISKAPCGVVVPMPTWAKTELENPKKNTVYKSVFIMLYFKGVKTHYNLVFFGIECMRSSFRFWIE